MMYRKKPVEIEAYQLKLHNGKQLAKWCGGNYREEGKPSDPTDVSVHLDIPTLEGVMTANRGDYIIKGIQGEFYPCKPDIFNDSYDLVK